MAEEKAVTPAGLRHYHDTYVKAGKIPYGAYGKATVKDALDELLYKPVTVKSFSNNVNVVENGRTITNVTLSWTLTGVPTEVKIGTEAVGTDLTGSKSLTEQNIKSDTSWTITAKDAKGTTATRTTGIKFKNKAYWGVAKPADANAVDSAFILGLTGNTFADGYARDFTVNAAEGNYIFYAYPASFGDGPRYFVGGFEGGFSLYKTFDFTNASGATVSYHVFKSTNPNLGNTTVTVK